MTAPTRTSRTPDLTDLATAAATGAITAWLPAHRWSRRAQWSMHGGFGALAATGALVGGRVRRRDPQAEPVPIATLAGLAGALGLLTTAVSRGGQGADAWVERRLAARGVRRPRLWMGVGAAGISLAMSVAERRAATRPERPAPEDTTLDGPDARG
ncbi:hypothetical protein KDN32_09930 [Nocardioides sp. J2M5]|uniref:hypothetical protein n=1 Tax=Nocardioides palaemonis TaxID=2829810 RepID=UPI001BA80A42|nr:hypothetical protein [Nocardioides palaemonis]MBS2938060.1 hypothetical protein [Nocardioides palaemonis]